MSYIGNQPAPTNIPVSNLDGVTSTNTELNFVDGVTSNVQTQLNAKQPYATIAVTVVNSGGNKYALDGTVQQLALLTPSVTYRFDQSDSSNSGHPLLLSTTSNGTHGGGSAFTTGVTAVGTPGSAGAYTEVKLEQDAPDTLYYYCTNHSGMGGEIDVKATVSSLSDLSVTATAAELNYVDGVTSNVQTQLDAKLPLAGGTMSGDLTLSSSSGNRAIVVTSTNGIGSIEVGGSTNAFIDIKIPDTDDFDTRYANNSLNCTGDYVFQRANSTKLAINSLGADVTGEFIADSYNETYAAVTSSSNATTVDCHNGNAFSHVLTENTTFTFSNPPASGTAFSFSIEIIQDASASGYTVTWPASVDWPSATAPTLTATANAKDVFVFYTRDGGTNFYGFTAGQALG